MHITSAPAAHSSLTRRRLVTVTIVAALAVVTGCSDEQRRDLGEQDTREALVAQVERVIADQGLELDGGLDCTAITIATSQGALGLERRAAASPVAASNHQSAVTAAAFGRHR